MVSSVAGMCGLMNQAKNGIMKATPERLPASGSKKERKRLMIANKRKRLLGKICTTMVFCLLLTFWGGIHGFAAETGVKFPSDSVPTAVYLDGRKVLAGECVLIRSVTYVPLRNFCNLFGSSNITWNSVTGTATVRNDDLTMTVKNGAVYLSANEHYFYTVGEIRNLNGHLYVPIRPLAKAFAATLSWNVSARCVELTSPTGNIHAVAQASYSANDVYWLSRIINAEAGAEPMKGQLAVGNVVLNRVASPSYPNSIYGVIFDQKYGTQFSPVSFGTIYNNPSQNAIIAAKMCLEGYTLSDRILFFMNSKIATTNWIAQARPYAFTIGNHDFYY